MRSVALALLFVFLAACSVAGGPVSAQIDGGSAGYLLVGNKGEDSVSFIDLKSGRELSRRPTAGPAPHEIAISPGGKQAAVVHYGGEGVELFDVAERKSLGTIKLPDGARPHGIAWLADGRIVVSAEGIDAILVLQPCRPTMRCASPAYFHRAISTGQKGSHMVAVSPDARRTYVSNLQSRTVTVIDLVAGKKIVDLKAAEEPEGIALSPDGKELWVASRGSDKVHVYNTVSFNEVATIDAGSFPIRLAISPDGKYAVTSDLGDGSLTVIDTATRKVSRRIRVSGVRETGQVTILFSADGKRLYAAETAVNKIAEVDFVNGKLIGRLSGGGQGDGLAIAPAAK